MGLSNSRLDSRRSRSRSRSRVNRSSSLSSFLLCGASSSRASYQMEENRENTNEIQSTRVELSSGSVTSSTPGFPFSNPEIEEAGSGNCGNGGSRTIGISNTASAHLPESNKESRDSNIASSSNPMFKDQQQQQQQSPETVSSNISPNTNPIHGPVPAEDQSGEASFGSPATFHPFGNDPIEEEEIVPSGLGFLVSNRDRSRPDGSVLHVDVLSISSNVLSNSGAERSSREARRNGRRMFWDAFSRRSSSRRLLDSPTFVFSMDEDDDAGSRDGWVFGLSGDFFDDANGSDSGYLGGGRIQYSSDRRLHSRSEVWERLRSGFDESGRRNTFCPSGIHPDGSCSCESLLINEESNTRASISRIVMLAEALFEVLDEIHRQPVSLSLSMVSSPAPASIVDAFPLKSHSKIDKGNEDVTECYICLADYEEGDKIRVLPCHHEYHMSCVDKWLKEIHGVCPLCRGDVREGLTECSVANSEIPSV